MMVRLLTMQGPVDHPIVNFLRRITFLLRLTNVTRHRTYYCRGRRTQFPSRFGNFLKLNLARKVGRGYRGRRRRRTRYHRHPSIRRLRGRNNLHRRLRITQVGKLITLRRLLVNHRPRSSSQRRRRNIHRTCIPCRHPGP